MTTHPYEYVKTSELLADTVAMEKQFCGERVCADTVSMCAAIFGCRCAWCANKNRLSLIYMCSLPLHDPNRERNQTLAGETLAEPKHESVDRDLFCPIKKCGSAHQLRFPPACWQVVAKLNECVWFVREQALEYLKGDRELSDLPQSCCQDKRNTHQR